MELKQTCEEALNREGNLPFLHSDENNFLNFFPLAVLFRRDVTRGNHMHQSFARPGSAAAAVPAIAATAGQFSSDEMLVKRIAAGDKLAMQVLFARHRTNIYRWLFRFVGNETVAEDLLSEVFLDVWQQAGRFEGRAAVTTWLLRLRASRRSRPVVAGLMQNSTRPSRPLWPTVPTIRKPPCRRRAGMTFCGRP